MVVVIAEVKYKTLCLCPGGFCCCVNLDSSYQVSKIAEIFRVNQQGALAKQLDPSR